VKVALNTHNFHCSYFDCRSQSYDIGIYNYNANVVIGVEKIFLLLKRTRLQRWRCSCKFKSRRIGSWKYVKAIGDQRRKWTTWWWCSFFYVHVKICTYFCILYFYTYIDHECEYHIHTCNKGQYEVLHSFQRSK
jgi:hypothetical protein